MMPERLFNLVVWAGIGTFAVGAHLAGEVYWVSLATRAIVFAIAGVGLNLALGFGGMVSFGHAAFFGIGGYAVGILASHAQSGTPLGVAGLSLPGSQSMPLTWLVAVVFGGLAAALIGALSLRTTGAYFIMITLAFSQMFYHFTTSWSVYGGEDGISIYVRGGFPGVETLAPLPFFGLCYAVLTLAVLLVRGLDRSAFGLSLDAVRQSPERVETVGIAPFRLQLTAFVLSGMITALAGALFADLNRYVSPAMFSWQVSGEIMIFVILGGVARLMGPVVGAVVFVLLEEVLGGLSEHWHIYLGLLLLATVLFARGGLTGVLARRASRRV